MKMNLHSKGSRLSENYKSSLAILILIVSLFSCGIETKTVKEFKSKLETFIYEDDIDKYKAIVLLPGEGCSGCITDTERFVKTLETKDQIKVIFTAVKSLKILKLKLGIDLGSEHFIIDKENIFNQGRTYSIYPTVFHLENGKIVNFDYVSSH